MKTKGELPLSPYRVLDLTEGECLLAGRMMGDLGADVIQIEKPGGSPSRNKPPFYKDIPHPEKSLFWFAFCLNKRGITLDIKSADGRELFKKLVGTAHFVLECFEPGYLDSLDLGYQALRQINPEIILTSITPFGQTGPKAHYKDSELISWAASDMLYSGGDPDRPPIASATPLAGQQASMAAVFGSLTAHWHRRKSGSGQHVDVSKQEVMEWITMLYSQFWPCMKMEITRVGWGRPLNPRVYARGGFPCKDGYASITMSAAALWILKGTRNLFKWIEEEGMLPDWLKDYDWANYDLSKFKEQAEIDRYQEPAKNFFATKTKAELYRAGLERGILCAPARDFKDNYEDPHIRARGFWFDVEHPDLEESITYPGACFRMSESPLSYRRLAPHIGEHNQEIFVNEFGMSKDQMVVLKSNHVI